MGFVFALRVARSASVVLAAAVLAAVVPGAAFAQAQPQVANLAGVAAYPAFYVDRTVVVRGQLHDLNGRLSLEDGEGNRVATIWKSQARPDAMADVTGALWDLGRMKEDDPRLAGYNVTAVLGGGQNWPRPGEVFVFAAQKFVPAEASATIATIRSLVLEGPRAVGRQVTVVGQFSGRNLFGELPRAPGTGRWDFVVRSAGAAVWVTGIEPRGKDFQFDPDKRIDSNRWLQVTGTVQEDHDLLVIQATKVALSQPDATATAAAAAPQPKEIPPAAPPIVLFSVPVDGETDVATTASVRIQLSRTLDRASLAGHIRVGYLATPTAAASGIEGNVELEERSDAPSGAIAVLQIRFAQPLQRFRTVRVDLLDGIKAPDGQPLKPWQLTFTVGGQ